MVLGIDLGKSRVRLLSDDQAIVARTGGRLSVSAVVCGQGDEKGRATPPDSNEGVPGTADLCTILTANAKNTEPTTRFPDSIRLVLRNVLRRGALPLRLPTALHGSAGKEEINGTGSYALMAGCGAR
jgi:hypothetical protein